MSEDDETWLRSQAEIAAKEVGRYYGKSQFTATKNPGQSCADWFLEHWKKFPWTAPKREG